LPLLILLVILIIIRLGDFALKTEVFTTEFTESTEVGFSGGEGDFNAEGGRGRRRRRGCSFSGSEAQRGILLLSLLLLLVILIIIGLGDFVLRTEVSPRSTRITRKGIFNAEGERGRRRRGNIPFLTPHLRVSRRRLGLWRAGCARIFGRAWCLAVVGRGVCRAEPLPCHAIAERRRREIAERRGNSLPTLPLSASAPSRYNWNRPFSA